VQPPLLLTAGVVGVAQELVVSSQTKPATQSSVVLQAVRHAVPTHLYAPHDEALPATSMSEVPSAEQADASLVHFPRTHLNPVTQSGSTVQDVRHASASTSHT
jgi:hypothetical protein